MKKLALLLPLILTGCNNSDKIPKMFNCEGFIIKVSEDKASYGDIHATLTAIKNGDGYVWYNFENTSKTGIEYSQINFTRTPHGYENLWRDSWYAVVIQEVNFQNVVNKSGSCKIMKD